MTLLEELEQEIYDCGVKVTDVIPDHPILMSSKSRVYKNGAQMAIAIDRTLGGRLRYCMLAHEFGHIQTLFGGMGRSRAGEDRSEELAWQWAYERIAPQDQLMASLTRHNEDGRIDTNAVADDLEVPLWFIDRVLKYYAGESMIARFCL